MPPKPGPDLELEISLVGELDPLPFFLPILGPTKDIISLVFGVTSKDSLHHDKLYMCLFIGTSIS